jgi:SAM-dependent methyltransferase
MRESLMEVLADPVSGAPLRLEVTQRQGARIEAGRLIDADSGRVFPIVRGIPRFVRDEATYADSFGFQWNLFQSVQLDSATKAGLSRKRFDAEAGWSAEELAGRWVLDAGCGAGRFAEIAAARGANLVALDFSSAVEATAQTLAGFESVDVVQGDMLNPPFRAGAFDFAYSIGVVQHTPAPAQAVASVVGCVRAGGQFCFTIYARRPWTFLNGKYLIRGITRHVPRDALLRAIERGMPVLFPVTDRLFRVPLLGRVAQFVIPVATYVGESALTDEQRYREAVLDTFDMLSPRYDSPMTADEVESMLRDIGAREWSFRTRVPINVVGRR